MACNGGGYGSTGSTGTFSGAYQPAAGPHWDGTAGNYPTATTGSVPTFVSGGTTYPAIVNASAIVYPTTTDYVSLLPTFAYLVVTLKGGRTARGVLRTRASTWGQIGGSTFADISTQVNRTHGTREFVLEVDKPVVILPRLMSKDQYDLGPRELSIASRSDTVAVWCTTLIQGADFTWNTTDPVPYLRVESFVAVQGSISPYSTVQQTRSHEAEALTELMQKLHDKHEMFYKDADPAVGNAPRLPGHAWLDSAINAAAGAMGEAGKQFLVHATSQAAVAALTGV